MEMFRLEQTAPSITRNMAKCLECGDEWDNAAYNDLAAIVTEHFLTEHDLETEHGYRPDASSYRRRTARLSVAHTDRDESPLSLPDP